MAQAPSRRRVAQEITALGIKGVYQRKEYKRQYPEGEPIAQVVGFTSVEDNGQEGVELSFQQKVGWQSGSRRVIKDRLGRVVEDVGETLAPEDGKDSAVLDRQQGAVFCIPETARRCDRAQS